MPFSSSICHQTLFFFALSENELLHPPILPKYTINKSSLYKRLVTLFKPRRGKWVAGRGGERKLVTINHLHLLNFEPCAYLKISK